MALSPLHQNHYRHQQPFYLPITSNDQQQEHMANSLWNSSGYTILPSSSASSKKSAGMMLHVDHQLNCTNPAELSTPEAYHFGNDTSHLESKYSYELYQQRHYSQHLSNVDSK